MRPWSWKLKLMTAPEDRGATMLSKGDMTGSWNWVGFQQEPGEAWVALLSHDTNGSGLCSHEGRCLVAAV